MKKKLVIFGVIGSSLILVVVLIVVFITNLFQVNANDDGTPCVFDTSANNYLVKDFSKLDGYEERNDYLYKTIFFLDDMSSKEKQVTAIKKINKLAKKHKDSSLLDKYYSDLEAKISEKCGNYDEGGLSDNIKVAASDKNLGKVIKSRFTVTSIAWYYPADFGGGWHPGIDLGVSSGSKIYAPANGVVLSKSSSGGGYGNSLTILVQADTKVYSILFGHLSSYKLGVGTTFKKGDVLAYSGNTGNSSGPHLHMEIFLHKKSFDKVYKTYKRNHDYWFGLGYSSIGNCSNICRLKPHEVYGYKYMKSY